MACKSRHGNRYPGRSATVKLPSPMIHGAKINLQVTTSRHLPVSFRSDPLRTRALTNHLTGRNCNFANHLC
ncbi:unnamed protein product [Periconia digitata]|uniref:Uncharacterized protein n=1 Tax=Periconia digitata TaxID=1303443 RepID=A0A9W4UMX2_9PLEO|nr:unnamed protein product [Periconia digitata]